MELTGGYMNNEVMSKICLAGSTAPDTRTLACGHLLGSCNSAYCRLTCVHFHFLSGRSQKFVFEIGWGGRGVVISFGMNRNSDIHEEGEGAGHLRSWNLCQRTEYSEIP